MAYTYDEFLKTANASGVMDRFSQDDLTLAQKNPEYGLSMVSLMKDISGATTAEQRLLATEAANQLRKDYGVYGTGSSYASSYGSQINDLMNQVNNYGSFNYGNQDAYQQLLDSIAKQQGFSYDVSEDPTFGAYKKAYLREGERASANALAQASAASGGHASSYAVQAAQQANNYYAGQLADIIPTLQQNAYQQYLNDFNQKLSSLNALENDRSFNYQNYLNQYNQLQNSLGNLQNQEATDYQRYLDQISQQMQAEQLAQNSEQQKFDNAMALYNLLGYATPEVAEILGLNSGVAGVTGIGGSGVGGSGGSGGSGGDGSSVTGDGTVPNAMVIGALNAAETMKNAVENGAVPSDAESVSNRHTEDWVAIGNSRYTWPELASLIENGTVVVQVDENTGAVTYSFRSSNQGNYREHYYGGSGASPTANNLNANKFAAALV